MILRCLKHHFKTIMLHNLNLLTMFNLTSVKTCDVGSMDVRQEAIYSGEKLSIQDTISLNLITIINKIRDKRLLKRFKLQMI